MILEVKNFFSCGISEKFSGIVTDIPYKGCINNVLEEKSFDYFKFFDRVNQITNENSFIITFCNMLNLIDLRNAGLKFGWKMHTYQIWNKEPIRNWISWSFPLRTCEFILYLKKGNFKFNFRDGLVKPKVNRKNFGGSLKHTIENTNEASYGMYPEIVTYKTNRKKIHPTEKPEEFSKMFKQITNDSFVLDPFCGSGNLIKHFSNAIGYDIKKWWD